MPRQRKVNGHVKSFTSLKLFKESERYYDFTEANYKNTMERGEAWGSGRELIGYTRGRLKPEGNLKFHIDEWAKFRDSLGPGYMDKVFPLTVIHSEPGDETIHTDELEGCRIGEVDKQNSEGTDPTMVTVPIAFTRLTEDGIPAIMEDDD